MRSLADIYSDVADSYLELARQSAAAGDTPRAARLARLADILAAANDQILIESDAERREARQARSVQIVQLELV